MTRNFDNPVGGVVAVMGMLFGSAVMARADSIPPAAIPPLRTYTQELSVEFASPEDAAKAQVAVTPVYQGKQWAFSARWDDNSANNIPVHDVMAKTGILGTFYINESRGMFSADYAKKLTSEGLDIGGHTQTHRLLHALLPNEVFYEILANRVQREADTDKPMNAFAFPGGVWKDRADPISQPTITQSVLRSGFLICPYMEFALSNPDMPAGAMATGHQVGPGDHKVDAANFDKVMDRVLSARDARIKQTYLIHMGVHARQVGEELKKLEGVFQKYAGKSDWWYCTMTDYAAYSRQVAETKIEPGAVEGAKRTFKIIRVAAGEVQSGIPITIEITGAAVASATGDGFECAKVDAVGRALFDLHHTAAHSGPTTIDAIDNKTNVAEPAYTADAPAVRGWLYRASDSQLKLTLQNTSGKTIESANVTLRLPPLYVEGVRKLSSIALAVGEKKDIDVPLGQMQADASFKEGKPYFVAEVDYRTGDTNARLYATTRLPHEGTVPCLRDAARMVGPFVDGDVKFESLADVSKPGAAFTDPGTAANLKWYVSTANERLSIKPDRATLYRNDKDWKAIAGPLDNKPQWFLLGADFTTNEATKLQLSTDATIVGVLLDGAQQPAGKEIDVPAAGKHRFVLMIQTKDNRAIWTAYPLYLQVLPQSGTLTFEVVPPAP